MEKYDSEKGGKPPYHPRMMLVLLLYSYCIGVFTSRSLAGLIRMTVSNATLNPSTQLRIPQKFHVSP
ncbi:MAG: transposase, partial [Planctomycetota bacterium]